MRTRPRTRRAGRRSSRGTSLTAWCTRSRRCCASMATRSRARSAATWRTRWLTRRRRWKAQTAQGAPAEGPAPGGDGQAAEQQKKDEGVIDAEYVDVEDKK